jgi:hypothetical protein
MKPERRRFIVPGSVILIGVLYVGSFSQLLPNAEFTYEVNGFWLKVLRPTGCSGGLDIEI